MKEIVLKYLKSLYALMFLLVCSVGVVHAQGTGTVSLTNVSLDTTSVLSLAAIIMAAIGAIWGIKKLIKLANRS